MTLSESRIDAADLPDDLSPQLRAEFGALADAARWKVLAPPLHVTDQSTFSKLESLPIGDETSASVMTALKDTGYFQLAPVAWNLSVSAIADAIRAVTAAGYLPVFAYMYDETWLLFMRLHRLLQAVLGEDYKVQPAFWAWHVDGRREQAGWTPHRDQDHTALRPDRSPKSLTVWIPLTEATPLNGCMYILPAYRDGLYAASFAKDMQIDLQDIRALPSPAGGVLGWTHAALHWGGRASPNAPTPRISVSMEFQRGDERPSKTPLYDPTSLPSPALRLKLILRQLLQYQHLYQLSPDLKTMAEAITLRRR